MKTAIIYVSSHHGNTKKVIDEMATVKDIDLFKISQAKATDFSNYDAIGFASGAYYHKLHKGIEKLASEIDLAGKESIYCLYLWHKLHQLCKRHPRNHQITKL